MAPAGRTAYALLEVVDPGPLALIEDRGRPGLAALGVSPSGAADRAAFALGARLLGQGSGQAAVECLAGGLSVLAHRSVTVALTGAQVEAELDGIPAPYAAPFLLRDGQVLRLGRPQSGLRAYLSVRGGVEVTPVLGSRSFDMLAGLGPPPLSPGQVLEVGAPVGVPTVDVAPVRPPGAGLVVLDVLPGPRLDWLADPGRLAAETWRVGSASDRVGLRLDGTPLQRSGRYATAELASEGIVRGAVQLPPSGRPVIFLADHPVTGGYPVVAVLTRAAADRAAQVMPGQEVRLRLATSRVRA